MNCPRQNLTVFSVQLLMNGLVSNTKIQITFSETSAPILERLLATNLIFGILKILIENVLRAPHFVLWRENVQILIKILIQMLTDLDLDLDLDLTGKCSTLEGMLLPGLDLQK